MCESHDTKFAWIGSKTSVLATHNEQDDQEPHTDVAKDEPRHGDSVAGQSSGRFSNLREGEVAENDCQQCGRGKKNAIPQARLAMAFQSVPVGPVYGGSPTAACKGVPQCLQAPEVS
jgi:hypothetical protein